LFAQKFLSRSERQALQDKFIKLQVNNRSILTFDRQLQIEHPGVSAIRRFHMGRLAAGSGVNNLVLMLSNFFFFVTVAAAK
jgi:hypothetical protein